jgi:hypothetical protein
MITKTQIMNDLAAGHTRFGAWKVRIDSSIHTNRYQAYISGPINTLVDQPTTISSPGLSDIYDRASSKLLDLFKRFPSTEPDEYFENLAILEAFQLAYPKLAKACEVTVDYTCAKKQIQVRGSKITSLYSIRKGEGTHSRNQWKFSYLGGDSTKKEPA